MHLINKLSKKVNSKRKRSIMNSRIRNIGILNLHLKINQRLNINKMWFWRLCKFYEIKINFSIF